MFYSLIKILILKLKIYKFLLKQIKKIYLIYIYLIYTPLISKINILSF